MITVVAIMVAGGVGAALRFTVDAAVAARSPRYPVGTTVINLSGSLLLGLVVGVAVTPVPAGWQLVLGTGLLGGYTTFSTAAYETVRLLEGRRYGAAALNCLGQLVLAVALAWLGFWVGRAAG